MLNYQEVFQFMREFGVDCMNAHEELIIDLETNTYSYIGNCKDIDDVKTMVMLGVTRPIYKGLKPLKAKMLQNRVNQYFNINLQKEDFGKIYVALCYEKTIPAFKKFIQDGFPMDKIEEYKNGEIK